MLFPSGWAQIPVKYPRRDPWVITYVIRLFLVKNKLRRGTKKQSLKDQFTAQSFYIFQNHLPCKIAPKFGAQLKLNQRPKFGAQLKLSQRPKFGTQHSASKICPQKLQVIVQHQISD